MKSGNRSCKLLTTETRVTHLYSLMDSAYDAEPIRSFIVASERIPIIDRNPRRLTCGVLCLAAIKIL